jgi:hypothetical protein
VLIQSDSSRLLTGNLVAIAARDRLRDAGVDPRYLDPRLIGDARAELAKGQHVTDQEAHVGVPIIAPRHVPRRRQLSVSERIRSNPARPRLFSARLPETAPCGSIANSGYEP